MCRGERLGRRERERSDRGWKKIGGEEREKAHVEARSSVEKLDDMSHTGLGGLVKLLLLELLNHVEDNVLAREESPSFQDLQDQLESLFLHDGPEELATAAPDGGPEQSGDLLLVLVHHQQLRDRAVRNGASRAENSRPAIRLQELTADDSHQLLEHGASEVMDDLTAAGLR